MSVPTDEFLMQKLKEGQTACLGQLYERYRQLLANYFLRVTTDWQASNDLLMETFERVFKYKESYMIEKAFKPWLYSIAHNLVNDHFKKINRHLSINNQALVQPEWQPEVASDQKKINDLLYKAMAKLPVDQRQIVNQYYLLGMPYKDIASEHQITENTARIRVCRALKTLKVLLKDSGI